MWTPRRVRVDLLERDEFPVAVDGEQLLHLGPDQLVTT